MILCVSYFRKTQGDFISYTTKTNNDIELKLIQAEIYDKLFIAEKQIQSGELLDGEEVTYRLNKKYID